MRKYTGKLRTFVSNYARESNRDAYIGMAGFLTSASIAIGSVINEQNHVAPSVALLGTVVGMALSIYGAAKKDTLEWGLTHTSDKEFKNLVLGEIL